MDEVDRVDDVDRVEWTLWRKCSPEFIFNVF